MGFLAPAFLVAGLAVAVPLLLHLLHRSERRRVAFPALRYLLRTEKEHARRIRLRQWLLLAIRCAIVLLLALAAARTVLRGGGAAHPPTAVAIVLDNSLSSQRVIGEGRVLDTLKARALEVVDLGQPGDRFWVLRAGEPEDVAPPLGPEAARVRIEETMATDAAGALVPALDRARRLLADAELEHAEIHLLSDLQASAFRDEPAAAVDGPPVLVWDGLPAPEPNRYLRTVVVGGGLAPRAGRRTEFAITVGAPVGDSLAAPVRLFLRDQLRGAADARAEATVLIPAGPFPEGTLEGYAETDPDALRADDRRWLVTTVAPPPAVATVGEVGAFVREALAVLEEGGRLRVAPATAAEVVLSTGAEGIAGTGARRVVVIPPADPALRTAVNQRLASAGVALRFGPPAAGREIATDETGLGLEGVRLATSWAIEGEGDLLAVRDDGVPWMVRAAGEPEVILVGSPLGVEATTLPVEAAMVPFFEWLAAGGAGDALRVEAGDPLSLPAAATAVETPDGLRVATGPSRRFPATRKAGIHRILAGDSVIGRIAVNPPLAESRLDRVEDARLANVAGPGLRVVESAEAWPRTVFAARAGQELWRPLLVATLLLLLVEIGLAASGGAARARSRSPSTTP